MKTETLKIRAIRHLRNYLRTKRLTLLRRAVGILERIGIDRGLLRSGFHGADDGGWFPYAVAARRVRMILPLVYAY